MGVFKKQIEVQFHDADPAGIMFFGNSYAFAHGAYESFVQHLGFTWKEWFANPTWAVPIRHSSCEYLAPLRPGQTYSVNVFIEKLGSTSMTLKYRFERDTKTHCEVTLVHSFIDIQKLAKTEIPSVVRERLETYQSESLSAQ